MKAVILCGGLGERIREFYPDTVKSLIKFNEKPFIHYQIELLIKNGFRDVAICEGYGGEQLDRYFTLNRYNINISLFKDGDELLGTGGAIRNILRFLTPEFMVIYGDSYLDFDYQKSAKKFIESDKLGLMTIYLNNNKYDKSNVRYNPQAKRILSYRKNKRTENGYRYIDYGAGFFRRDAFLNMPHKFDLAYLYEDLLIRNELDSDLIENRFYEIGSIKGIKEFDEYIRSRDVR